MGNKTLISIIVLLSLIISSCKKDKKNTSCLPNAVTERVITQKQAKINITGGRVYIVEKGTIDTRLVPCNLADEFRVNGLDVIVSGEVKVTPDVAGEPCCVSDIVITEISR